jgi:DNA replication licensing factor MCM2
MSALDRYDSNLLDDEEYSEMSQGERIAAEVEMRKRDRAAGIIRDDRDLLYGNFLFFFKKNKITIERFG